LPPESAWELLQALVGDAPEIAPLKHRLIETTEGNPLFLEESVRTLVETGALAGERGAYRLTRPVKYLEIPATVQAILAARIDRLAPEGKHLLQAAAVVGNDVPMPFLLAIAEAREDAVRAGLGRLQTAEFLYERRLFPDLEYSSASVAGRPRSFLLSAPSPPAARRRTSTTRSALVVKPSIWPSLGMRPLVAHCHLGLGKLYRRMGDREQASEHLTTATAMYREMDMRFWLEQAEAGMQG
jgi:hypothetical protein